MCLSSYTKRRQEYAVCSNSFLQEMLTNCTNEKIPWLNNPELDVHNNNHVTSTTNNTIDFEKTPFINRIWYVVPVSEILIKTSAFLPVIIWGMFGNITLLYVIIKNRHIRTPTNLLIGNMAAADLASIMIHPWVFLVYDFFQNYQLGKFGCKAEGAVECSILLASVMSLLAISYDRLTAIVLPQETRLTRRTAKIVMAVTWVVGLILASPLFIYRTYKERQWLDFLEKYCTEDTIVINIYWHVIITMLVWLPLTIMLICYISIFVKLNHYENVILRRCQITQVNYKKKVAKMMFVVVVTFMCCRLPFTALIFYRNQLLKNQNLKNQNQVQNQVNGTYQILWFISKYLIFVNAGINPVIYGLTNEKFRRAFKTTALSKWLFPAEKKKTPVAVPTKKKETHSTEIPPSPKHKIFTIFKGRKCFPMKTNIEPIEINANNNNNSVFDHNSKEKILKI